MLCSKIPTFFKKRRDALMLAHPGALFLLPAQVECVRNSDVHYPFRQESHFFYLTGLEEPSGYLVLAPSSQGAYRMILFILPKDPTRELWDGERYGVERAMSVFGADEAYPADLLSEKFPELLANAETLFYRLGVFSGLDQKVIRALEAQSRFSGKVLMPIQDPHGPIGEMRLFKSPEEVEFLRKACQVSAQAHRTLMIETQPHMNEADLEARLDFVFRTGGCQRVGYPSIVAGGRNATCLHYHMNHEPLKKGDLVLVDAGGEFCYYSADITRTFPVGGVFSPEQAEIYDWVLKAQKAGIALAKPGATLPQIHQRVCEVLVEGLLSLGLLKGQWTQILKGHEYRRFYPHQTSHWLGMDVHDTGLAMKQGQPRVLEPGMVFTIEPGLYIQPSEAGLLPAGYVGIGVRIEDDFLITPTGHENLTETAPKEREEIEALRP